jgi:hypothetical protein
MYMAIEKKQTLCYNIPVTQSNKEDDCMQQLIFLLKNFFTHKDFLPPADQLPGTIYTPLHWVVSMLLLAIVIGLAVWLGRRCEERTIRRILLIIWIYAIVFEPTKILWETFCGKEVSLEVGGVLPFYPCSVFMLALPLLVFGGRRLRICGGGYLCTIGMLGAMINFFYPINVLSNYSCISFAGAHTLLYHGAMLFCCLLIQISGYHRYSYARNVGECFFAALPLLIWSIPANIINYSPIGSDYMFFKCNSFFLPAIFGGIPDPVTTVLAYLLYTLLPALFYLPAVVARKSKASVVQDSTV